MAACRKLLKDGLLIS